MPIRTFHIETLGCRVNQYESEQLAALLRDGGLSACDDPRDADLRIINTCSVTVQAAGKSRQAARRAARQAPNSSRDRKGPRRVLSLPQLTWAGHSPDARAGQSQLPPSPRDGRARVIVTGCWATSDPQAAAALPGVDAVIGHRHDVAAELGRLLHSWRCTNADANVSAKTTAAGGDSSAGLRLESGLNVGSAHSAGKAGPRSATSTHDHQPAPDAVADAREADVTETAPKPLRNDGWINLEAGSSAGVSGNISKADGPPEVNQNIGSGAF
jgi:hypothetical protein